jgi:hypothetical protein
MAMHPSRLALRRNAAAFGLSLLIVLSLVLVPAPAAHAAEATTNGWSGDVTLIWQGDTSEPPVTETWTGIFDYDLDAAAAVPIEVDADWTFFKRFPVQCFGEVGVSTTEERFVGPARPGLSFAVGGQDYDAYGIPHAFTILGPSVAFESPSTITTCGSTTEGWIGVATGFPVMPANPLPDAPWTDLIFTGTSEDGFYSAAAVVRSEDRDGDLVVDAAESAYLYGTNPDSADTDGDCLEDGPEIWTYRTNPHSPDSDGDGFRDDAELIEGTDPNDSASGGGSLELCGLGVIEILKETQPETADAAFEFVGNPHGLLSDDGTTLKALVPPGTYQSTELAAEEWQLDSIVCDDANSTWDLGTRTATFRVEAGERVRCIFTNAQLVCSDADRKFTTFEALLESRGLLVDLELANFLGSAAWCTDGQEVTVLEHGIDSNVLVPGLVLAAIDIIGADLDWTDAPALHVTDAGAGSKTLAVEGSFSAKVSVLELVLSVIPGGVGKLVAPTRAAVLKAWQAAMKRGGLQPDELRAYLAHEADAAINRAAQSVANRLPSAIRDALKGVPGNLERLFGRDTIDIAAVILARATRRALDAELDAIITELLPFGELSNSEREVAERLVEETLGLALPGALLGEDLEIPIWQPDLSIRLNPDGSAVDALDGFLFRPFVHVEKRVETTQ